MKIFGLIQGFFVVMAMATSAIELPDNMYGNSNNLVNYHQSEEGNLAYNLDHRASTYNLDNGDSLKQQLLHKFHKKSPITSRGVLAPPTMASSRPYYSNEIQSDTIRKGVNALGHNVGKRSPLVVPEDPFLVGGFLKKLSLPKLAKVAPIALPVTPFKPVNPFIAKKTFGKSFPVGLTVNPLICLVTFCKNKKFGLVI